MRKPSVEKPVVFISWSGKYSKSYEVAMLLHDWLPVVIQQIDFWISEDVELGKFAVQKILSKLFVANAGIFCITEKSINSKWLNYEAGAISKASSADNADDVNNVISLLIDISENDFSNSGSPLAHFQSVSIKKVNMFKLANTLNNLTANPLSENVLRKAFEANWETFEKGYNDIISPKDIEKSKAIEYKHKYNDFIVKDLYNYGIRLSGGGTNTIKTGCLFCIDVINRLNVPITVYEICVRFGDGSTYNVEHKSGYLLTGNDTKRRFYSDTLPLTINSNSFSPLFYLLAADDAFLKEHNGENVSVICKTDVCDMEKEIDFIPVKNEIELFNKYFANNHDNT